MSTDSEADKDHLRAKLRSLSLDMEDAGMGPLSEDEIEALVRRLTSSPVTLAAECMQRVADHLNGVAP